MKSTSIQVPPNTLHLYTTQNQILSDPPGNYSLVNAESPNVLVLNGQTRQLGDFTSK